MPNVSNRRTAAILALLGGAVLIATGIGIALRQPKSAAPKPEKPLRVQQSIEAPATPAPSPTSKPIDANDLGLTLEEFQTRYEAVAAKPDGQEQFFQGAIGKRAQWRVRVDHVFRVDDGIILVFSAVDRPDWAAFPISDAHFPLALETRLMALQRGAIVTLKGKIAARGIKTLECDDFE